jgi:hypothetical protein
MSDLEDAAFIFKRKFTQTKIDMIAEREHPRWGRLTRKPGFTGSEVAYDILTGNPQGISGNFEVAQRNASSSKGKQPKVTRRKKFGVIRIDAERPPRPKMTTARSTSSPSARPPASSSRWAGASRSTPTATDRGVSVGGPRSPAT